jgi:hypothetical protein
MVEDGGVCSGNNPNIRSQFHEYGVVPLNYDVLISRSGVVIDSMVIAAQ